MAAPALAPEVQAPRAVPGASSKHLPALTGFRFVLALWVILHHLSAPGQMLDAPVRALPYVLYALVRGGYLAVTTFFVLSGFVLARRYASTDWSRRTLMRYGLGRVARVYPVYLLSLAAVAPFIVADTIPGKTPLVAAHGLLIQGWIPRVPVSWNTPAWSLSCEIFFYMMFPVAAIAMRRAGWPVTMAVAVLACCLTQVLWRMGVPDEIKPVIHLSDFLMGIAASRAFDRMRRVRGVWLYGPALVMSAALIAFPWVLPSAVHLNTALRPLNAVLLLGFALGGGAVARALSTPTAVYLGKSSYAMYILHVPILWWYLRCSHAPSAAVYVAIVIGVSAVVYRFVEEPANRYLRALI
jgi:peptidoglycan/LPS O-acetylase OafA/YrhL